MDPDTALWLVVSALDAGDRGIARLHAEDLRDWLRHGGFPPQGDWRAVLADLGMLP